MKYDRLTSIFCVLLVSIPFALFLGSYLRSENSAIAQSSSSDSIGTYPDLEAKIVTFFDELEGGSSSNKPFQDLLKSGPLDDETEMFTSMRNNLSEIQKQFGEYRSKEPIDVRAIGKSKDLIVIRYLYKCEKHPVLWQFTFYRSPNPPSGLSTGVTTSSSSSGNWTVIGIRFDTNLDGLLGPYKE